MPSIDPSAPATRPLHWVLPFASSLSDPCLHALSRLGSATPLPHLERLLAVLTQQQRFEADEYALSMPHERVLAAELGWADLSPAHDGLLPWSAWWATQDGLQLDPALCWATLSVGHWLMGREQLTLLDPTELRLSDADSRTCLEAVRSLFEEEGWTLLWGSATRWYAAHPSLQGLPTASLDRVIGRNPDVWLTDHPQARRLRRLQSEVQMSLYQHPLNDAREAAGQPTVNSFWLSGGGRPPAALTWPDTTVVCDALRAPLLATDMPAWIDTWAQVDATVLREACAAIDAGHAVRITLCGERHALSLSAAAPAPLGQRLWQSLRSALGGGTRQAGIPDVLQSL